MRSGVLGVNVWSVFFCFCTCPWSMTSAWPFSVHSHHALLLIWISRQTDRLPGSLMSRPESPTTPLSLINPNDPPAIQRNPFARLLSEGRRDVCFHYGVQVRVVNGLPRANVLILEQADAQIQSDGQTRNVRFQRETAAVVFRQIHVHTQRHMSDDVQAAIHEHTGKHRNTDITTHTQQQTTA